jgi:hypothetical protein
VKTHIQREPATSDRAKRSPGTARGAKEWAQVRADRERVSNVLRPGLRVEVSEPGDAREREATRMAGAACEECNDRTPLHIQRFTTQPTGQVGFAPASVTRVLATSGRPLEPALRQDMEQRFGHDFSRVRVHTGAAAAQSTRDVNAHAYTVGTEIVFGARKFAPESREGKNLLAHELTHVVQQEGASASRLFRQPDLTDVGLTPKTPEPRSLRETLAVRSLDPDELDLEIEQLQQWLYAHLQHPEARRLWSELSRLQKSANPGRKGGWPDASTKGEAWNDRIPKQVGKIWRIAIAGLKGGTTKPFKGGDSAHTTETADQRAIVLIPDGFEPDKPVEVLLYFHGHTEAWRGHYAGYRQRSFKQTDETKKAGLVSDDTVRDVALDQIENQVEQSGHRQMIGILAQGGPQHQFGEINADVYIEDVLKRVNAEYPAHLKKVPSSWKVLLSGHSGGGFEVRGILSSDSRKPANLKAIILFDANNMSDEIGQRLEADLKFLADPAKNDADRSAYLTARPSVRVFATSNKDKATGYGAMYIELVEQTIRRFTEKLLPGWQQRQLDALKLRQACGGGAACKPLTTLEQTRFAELTQKESRLQAVQKFLPIVRPLYQVTRIDESQVRHEEIIRGASAKSGAYKPGQGNLEKALQTIPVP